MAKIHNTKLRMPFILPKGTEHEWLNVNLKDYEIIDLMKPLVDGELEVHEDKIIDTKIIVRFRVIQ